MEYEISGGNMQSLKVHLALGEAIYSDSGMLVSKDANVIMTPRAAGGIVSMLERKVTGATALLTEFKAVKGEGHMEIAGVLPGKVFVIDLKPGEKFICEDAAFLAAEESVKFTMTAVNIGAAWFGGEGFFLQEFIGPGKVFIHIVGDIITYTLDGTGTIELEPGHMAGFDGGISYKVKFVDNIRSAMWGGVGLFLATFSGKGRVISHSVSRRKLAAAIWAQAQAQNKNKK